MIKFIFLAGMWINIYSIDYYYEPEHTSRHAFYIKNGTQCLVALRGSSYIIELKEGCDTLTEEINRTMLIEKVVAE